MHLDEVKSLNGAKEGVDSEQSEQRRSGDIRPICQLDGHWKRQPWYQATKSVVVELRYEFMCKKLGIVETLADRPATSLGSGPLLHRPSAKHNNCAGLTTVPSRLPNEN